MQATRFLRGLSVTLTVLAGLSAVEAEESKGAVGIYVKLLASDDPAFRVEGAAVLGTRGADAASALPALQAAAADMDYNVRLTALNSISMILKAVDGQSFEARAAARPDLVEALVPSTRDPSVQIRAAAATALGHSKHGVALDPLFELANDPAPSVRVAAIQAIARIGQRPEESASILARTTSDTYLTVRIHAIEGMNALGFAGANQTIPKLRELLYDSIPIVRLTAVQAAASIAKNCRGARGFERQFLSKQTAAAYPIDALAQHERDALQILEIGLRDAVPEVRRTCIDGIGSLTDGTDLDQTTQRHREAIADLLKDADDLTRLAAARALNGQWIAEESIVLRLAESLTDRDVNVRKAAADALGLCGVHCRPAQKELMRGLRDPWSAVRLAVARTVPFWRFDADTWVVDELVQWLSHGDAEHRRVAAESIGWIGRDSATAIPALIGLLSDSSVRTQAAQALGRIGAPARESVEALLGGELDRVAAAILHGMKKYSSECPLEVIEDNSEETVIATGASTMVVAVATWCPYSRQLVSFLNDPQISPYLVDIEIVFVFVRSEWDLMEERVATQSDELSTDTREEKLTEIAEARKESSGRLVDMGFLVDLPGEYYYAKDSRIDRFPMVLSATSREFDQRPLEWLKTHVRFPEGLVERTWSALDTR